MEETKEDVHVEGDRDLYRFRSFNVHHSTEPHDIILKDRLFCASPSSFNDPFDCSPDFTFEPIPVEEQIRRAQAMILRRGITADDPEALKLMQGARDGIFNHPIMAEKIIRGMRQSIVESSVCCFQGDWRNPQMWAHYAGNHTGYCLYYFLDDQWPDGLAPLPVIYAQDRPRVDLGADLWDPAVGGRYVEDALLTKSHHWQGENELRFVRAGVAPGQQTMSPTSLRGIYLGMNISEDNEQHVLTLARARSSPVPVYKLRPDEKLYKFNVEPL